MCLDRFREDFVRWQQSSPIVRLHLVKDSKIKLKAFVICETKWNGSDGISGLTMSSWSILLTQKKIEKENFQFSIFELKGSLKCSDSIDTIHN